MSFVLIIVVEMFIGTNVGLGYRIVNSQMVYCVPDMYASIFLAGLAGYLGNKSLLLIERRLLHLDGPMIIRSLLITTDPHRIRQNSGNITPDYGAYLPPELSRVRELV